jgi:hypothetical protein
LKGSSQGWYTRGDLKCCPLLLLPCHLLPCIVPLEYLVLLTVMDSRHR